MARDLLKSLFTLYYISHSSSSPQSQTRAVLLVDRWLGHATRKRTDRPCRDATVFINDFPRVGVETSKNHDAKPSILKGSVEEKSRNIL